MEPSELDARWFSGAITRARPFPGAGRFPRFTSVRRALWTMREGASEHLAEVALFHTNGATVRTLRIGTAHRLLDAGRLKPILFQLEDDAGPAGLWVVKAPSRDRRGPSGLLYELAGSEVAAWLGVRTPAVALVEFPSTPPPLAETTEFEREVAEMFRQSAGGLGFCSRYLEGSDPVQSGEFADLRSVPAGMRDDCVRVFALDVLLRHYDRTNANSNLLVYENRVIAVDHGMIASRLGSVDESGFPSIGDLETNYGEFGNHVCASLVEKIGERSVWAETAARVAALDDVTVDEMAARWPEALDVGPGGQRAGIKPLLARFLKARRREFAKIMEAVRGCLSH